MKDDDLSEEIHGNMIFSVYMYKCYKYDITLLQKKSQRRSSPEKMHLKVIDFLDQIPERVATILCTFMETLYGIYGLLGLAKINSMEFLEVKLLTENPCKG